MEGEEIWASMDSRWFYSSVFLRASSSKHKQSNCAEERQLRQQEPSAETRRTTSGSAGPGQPPRCCVKEEAAPTERRAAAGTVRAGAAAAAAAARSCREWDERMVAWRKEQRRRTVARCSQAPMPATGEGVAMKAHLRSWAHAVACSVR